MIAVDTNVLVRVVTNDDPPQARRAMRAMGSDRVWLSRTVLLETAWVLRHAYRLDDAAVVRAFSTLAGIPTIDIEGRNVFLRALAWSSNGMDFADALHLASSGAARAFVSFDRPLAMKVRRLGARPPVVGP